MNETIQFNQIKDKISKKIGEEVIVINLINNSLYFVKTKTKTYTYDEEIDSLELGQCLIDNEESSIVARLTEEEKDKIANENLKLIHYVISTMGNLSKDYEELESVGYLGFAKALESFNKMKEIRFATYAIYCIRNEILFFLKKEKRHLLNDVSLQKELYIDSNGNCLSLEDVIEDVNFSRNGVEGDLLKEEQKIAILKAIKKLNEKEQVIILHRYGLNGYPEKTQKDLAYILEMSQANISKLEKIALKKLRIYLREENNN